MENWQPGDIALCVKGGAIEDNGSLPVYPEEGREYTVLSLKVRKSENKPKIPFLVLLGAPLNHTKIPEWSEERFVKQKGHKEDEFDKEIIDIMQGKLLKYTKKDLV